LVTTAAAIIAIVAAFLVFPIRHEMGGWPGVAFWIVLTLLGAAMPVRLPQGTVASVSAAPIMAAVALGGPFAAALVTAIGTTDPREARGQVPWYGTVYNHAALVVSVVVGAVAYELVQDATAGADPVIVGLARFGGLILAATIFYVLGWILAVAAVSVRTGSPMRTIWAQDVSGVAWSLIGLAPLGWLMAEIFQLPNGVGWWATPLFVVPLFTTRLAYHRYVETRSLFEQTIGALAKAVDARDNYTRGHSGRVSDIAEAMSRVLRLPEHEIETIKWAGLLHDIGKIGVRDNILLKEGPLDRHERILMNQHPTIGAEIVAPATQLSKEAPLILNHHEWFNGSGYPNGTEALDIPKGARILGVADAYEAMTSARPYRKTPLTHEQAIGELRKYSGIQFDPELVPVLIDLPREILDRHPESDDELPTMLHHDDPRDRPRADGPRNDGRQDREDQQALPPAAAASTPTKPANQQGTHRHTHAKRRMLADDVS
jgi:putative nucleotidyltransferase with HDIG domain